MLWFVTTRMEVIFVRDLRSCQTSYRFRSKHLRSIPSAQRNMFPVHQILPFRRKYPCRTGSAWIEVEISPHFQLCPNPPCHGSSLNPEQLQFVSGLEMAYSFSTWQLLLLHHPCERKYHSQMWWNRCLGCPQSHRWLQSPSTPLPNFRPQTRSVWTYSFPDCDLCR